MPSRDDPHTAPQGRFLKALVREAHKRGHLKGHLDDITLVLHEVKNHADDVGKTVRWGTNAVGWLSTSNIVWIDTDRGHEANECFHATKGEVGQFIDLLTEWMPDMKPKHKRAVPKVLKEQKSVPRAGPAMVPKMTQEPGVECVLTVQLGLYERVPPERLQAVADLLKLWLQQISLPVHGDPQVEIYPPREEADQQV